MLFPSLRLVCSTSLKGFDAFSGQRGNILNIYWLLVAFVCKTLCPLTWQAYILQSSTLESSHSRFGGVRIILSLWLVNK
uniref:Uncharacterized protein n=1 Tax=Arundo donax TaxID=35708 RepID=A0A0A8XZY5_ARUDO